MNIMKTLAILILGAAIAVPTIALAEEQTITLKVNGMSCFTCPYQVKSALKWVDGVITASADLETGEAVVTFDDTVTNIGELTQATANAGFPSKLKIQ